jgi:hypothetical protein
VHAPGQLHVGQRAVLLQLGQDAQIDGVQLHMLLILIGGIYAAVNA